ncbi:tRNA-splicing ligase [Pelagophyceae sp. CCMP2097]|nr:tRNA-splicing ligase [Pelagophyceae sp. CCMP2097]
MLRRGARRLAGWAPLPTAMPIVMQTLGVPIHLFGHGPDLEFEALGQLIQLAESGLADHFVAAMPCTEQGKGTSGGAVFASKTLVAPHGAGGDIGCGMMAAPVDDLWADDLARRGKFSEKAQQLRDAMTRIPAGPGTWVPEAFDAKRVLKDEDRSHWLSEFLAKNEQHVLNQIGTLGSGGHFMEVDHDENGRVWLLLHTGSRHIGSAISSHYDTLARTQMKNDGRFDLGTKREQSANSLRADSFEGQAYLQDMRWAVQFARANRENLMRGFEKAVFDIFGREVNRDKIVHTHHNFCQLERCKFVDPKTGANVEEDLYVHRKGATSATPGKLSLLPGSLATGACVVRGKGLSTAWNSMPTGSGRTNSRTESFQYLKQEEFERSVAKVLCDCSEVLRDESPQAYNDLDKVLSWSRDLVDVVHRLHPLINVKGISRESGTRLKMGEAKRDKTGAFRPRKSGQQTRVSLILADDRKKPKKKPVPY